MEMKLNKSEIIELIKNGVNVLDFIKADSDIALISTSITIKGEDEDPFYEESAEMTLKAIIYYVMNVEGEEKTLSRCKEIAKIGYDNGSDELKKILEKTEQSRVLYVAMDIASEKTQKLIMEKLKERLLDF